MTKARKEDGDKSNFSWLLLHNGAEFLFFQKQMHVVHHPYPYFLIKLQRELFLKVQILYVTNYLHVPKLRKNAEFSFHLVWNPPKKFTRYFLKILSMKTFIRLGFDSIVLHFECCWSKHIEKRKIRCVHCTALLLFEGKKWHKYFAHYNYPWTQRQI